MTYWRQRRDADPFKIASNAEYRHTDYFFQRGLNRSDGVRLERSKPLSCISPLGWLYIATAFVFFAVGGAINLFI